MILKDLMGLAEYARYRKSRGLPGGTTQSVLNAVNSGRIQTVTVGKNRMVNPASADKLWALNTNVTRYSADQLAAMEGTTTAPAVASPGPSITPESVQADAWDMAFQNAHIAAAVLVHELGLEPIPALKAATSALSALLLCLGEATQNRTYLEGAVPEWATAMIDNDHTHPALIKALEDLGWLARELFAPDEEEPAEEEADPLGLFGRDLRAEAVAAGVL